jgi:hypothetical protein
VRRTKRRVIVGRAIGKLLQIRFANIASVTVSAGGPSLSRRPESSTTMRLAA